MTRIIVYEFILLLFSVFIFRSLWMLLDRCPWLGTDKGLLVSLMIGVLGTLWTLPRVHQCIKKDQSENF